MTAQFRFQEPARIDNRETGEKREKALGAVLHNFQFPISDFQSPIHLLEIKICDCVGLALFIT
jgi:hypothetical protein